MNARIIAVTAAALCFWHASESVANPLDPFGFGARAISLGGAVTARVHDFSSVYYNPAGLAQSEVMRIEIGYMYAEPFLNINDHDVNVNPSHGFQSGLVVPGKIFDKRLGFALGIHLPDNRVTRVKALPQSRPRFALFDNRPQRVVVSSALGFEVFDWLFLGAGLTFVANTSGLLDLEGSVSATRPDLTTLFTSANVQFDAIRYPTIGATIQATDELSFGVSYREEFVLKLDVNVRVRGEITLGEDRLILVERGLFLLNSLNHNLFSPRQVTLGAAYAHERFKIFAEIGWLDWSEFLAPTSKISLTLDLGDLDFNIPIPEAPEPPNFHDIFVPRVGVEVLLAESEDGFNLFGRAGYFFEASPAPDQSGLTNYLDSDKHAFSVGVGIDVPVFKSVLEKPLVFDAAFQWISLTRREFQKEDPADLVGDLVADGNIFAGATTLRLLF